jgi:hypothetical protein
MTVNYQSHVKVKVAVKVEVKAKSKTKGEGRVICDKVRCQV